MPTHIEARAACLAGIAAALVALELAVRPFSSAQLPPLPHISADSFDAPVVTSRQLEEGLSVAHFSEAGARLTGVPPVDGAPIVALLGDSYVVAREVRDDQTMGAWVERESRAANVPVDVRQYGWRGATPAQYLAIANELETRWHPARVVVVLSTDDLDAHPLTIGDYQLRIAPDGAVRLLSPNRAPATAKPPSTLSWADRSALVSLLRHRREALLLRAPRLVRRWMESGSNPAASSETLVPPTPEAIAAVPNAVVAELSRAFGERLRVIYVADVRVSAGETADSLEMKLLDACRIHAVRCVSTREPMLAARQHGAVVRGFPTSTLGEGHLNPAGHELVGRAIWSLLAMSDTARKRERASR